MVQSSQPLEILGLELGASLQQNLGGLGAARPGHDGSTHLAATIILTRAGND